MYLNLHTVGEELNNSGWDMVQVLSMNMTLTLLIQKPLLNSQILQRVLGNMLKSSNLDHLESGLLNINQMMGMSLTLDLSHFFVVPKMDLLVTLVRLEDGIGLQKPNWFLIVSKQDGFFDPSRKLDLLRLLKKCITNDNYLRIKKILLREY